MIQILLAGFLVLVLVYLFAQALEKCAWLRYVMLTALGIFMAFALCFVFGTLALMTIGVKI